MVISMDPSKEETVAPSRGGKADKEMEAVLYPGKAGRGIPAAGRRQGMVRDGMERGGIITRVIIRSPKRTDRLQGRRNQDDTGADRMRGRGHGEGDFVLLNRAKEFNRAKDRLLFICTIHNFTLLKL
jgi:hypothetical protein